MGFGHRRLTIIDPTPAGSQPMVALDGKVWLTYNGEIYNFRELFAEATMVVALGITLCGEKRECVPLLVEI